MDRYDCNIIVVFVFGVLNRGDYMDRFDSNIIVVFVFGVLNRGDHMDKFDCNIIVVFVFSECLIEVTTWTGLTVIALLCLF